MAQQYPIIEERAGGVVVLARTTVDAQQAAADALGGDCTITAVEKVHQGGIGGFFATELIQVTAVPSKRGSTDRELTAAMTSAEDLVSALRQRSPQFADRLMNELGRSPSSAPIPTIADQRMAFVERLSSAPAHIAPAHIAPVSPCSSHAAEHVPGSPTVVPPTVVPALVAPSTAAVPVIAPPGVAQSAARGAITAHSSDTSRWSPRSLRALGVPDRIVDLATASQPIGEADWIVALMGAFKSICATRTIGPVIMVGPKCANLARQLRLVSISPDEVAESVSSVAAPNASSAAVLAGLNSRQVHLVVGGAWQHLSGVQPAIVSAASADDLLEAIRVCVAWDATLGWCWTGDHYERLEVFTVVSHIRSILHNADQAPVDEHVASSADFT